VTALFLGRGFSDFRSLRDLEAGTVPSIADIRRRLFVEERRSDTNRPDHFYKAYLEERLGRATGVRDVAPTILKAVARRFLHRRGERLFVKPDGWLEWHAATSSLSPLAIAAMAIAEEERDLLVDSAPAGLVSGRIGDTAVLTPNLSALNELIDREGLVDIHMHLNGSTEVDRLWADAVMKPLPYLRELHGAFSKEGARELYDQIDAHLTPSRLYGRLRATRRARHVVAGEIRRVLDGEQPVWTRDRFASLFDPELDDYDAPLDVREALGRSPYLTICPGADDEVHPLHAEGAFLALAFSAFDRLPILRDYIGVMLWHSLTVFTQVARLSVQQPDQTGFHQFDKFNAAGARERLEKGYEDRLHQLNGPGRGNLSYVDARFAPKKTAHETDALLGRVVRGLASFRACEHIDLRNPLHGAPPPCFSGACSCAERQDRMDLALVAHFIKRPDRRVRGDADGLGAACRHSSLRHSLERQARALSRSIRRSPVLQTLVRGVDGAGNELDAPPEVFAPTFRRVRRILGSGGASFHVGEDYVHLLSGIRAVREAVDYLGLRDGDRVGHAVALGVPPEHWARRVEDRTLMRIEDVLDDAVFALTTLAGGRQRFGDEALLASWAEQYSIEIYDRYIGVATLYAAWALRSLDILAVRRLEQSFAGASGDLNAFALHIRHCLRSELDEALSSEIRLILAAVEESPEAFRVFLAYHTTEVRRRGARVVEMRSAPNDPKAVSMETLSHLQNEGLAYLAARGVVIETLPSSNVRIGGYRTVADHHLLRWLGLVPAYEARPRFAVGTDDPGIFSTNIVAEFAHIHAALELHTSDDVMRHLRRMNRTGREVRFRAPISEPPNVRPSGAP